MILANDNKSRMRDINVIASILVQCLGLSFANHAWMDMGHGVGRVGEPVYSFDPFAMSHMPAFTTGQSPLRSFPIPRTRQQFSRQRHPSADVNRFPPYMFDLNRRQRMSSRNRNRFGTSEMLRDRRGFGMDGRRTASFSSSSMRSNTARRSRTRNVNRISRVSPVSEGGFGRAPARHDGSQPGLVLMLPGRGRGAAISGTSRGDTLHELHSLLHSLGETHGSMGHSGIPNERPGASVVTRGIGGVPNLSSGSRIFGRTRAPRISARGSGNVRGLQQDVGTRASVLNGPNGHIFVAGVLPTMDWLSSQGIVGNNNQGILLNSRNSVGNTQGIMRSSQGPVGNARRTVGNSQGIVDTTQAIVGSSPNIVAIDTQGLSGRSQGGIGNNQGVIQGILGNTPGITQEVVGNSPRNILQRNRLPQSSTTILRRVGDNVIIDGLGRIININQLTGHGAWGLGQGQGRSHILPPEEEVELDELLLGFRQQQNQIYRPASSGIEIIGTGGNAVNVRRSGQGGVTLTGGGDGGRFSNVKIAQASTTGNQPVVISGSGSQPQANDKGQTFTIGTAAKGQGIIIGGKSGAGSNIVLGGSGRRSRTFTLKSRGTGQTLMLGSGPGAIELGAGTSSVQIPGNATFIIPGPPTQATPQEF